MYGGQDLLELENLASQRFIMPLFLFLIKKYTYIYSPFHETFFIGQITNLTVILPIYKLLEILRLFISISFICHRIFVLGGRFQ